MLNFGLELEYFIFKEGKLIPAHKVTRNHDGNPMIGEVRSIVSPFLVDCMFDIQKKIFKEKKALAEQFAKIVMIPEVQLTKDQLRDMRSSVDFNDRKQMRALKEMSVYGRDLSKILSRGHLKASLQVNISNNVEEEIITYKERKDASFNTCTIRTKVKEYRSTLFDYAAIIRYLDEYFKIAIKETKRTPGVFCIKSGEKGDRIEYRSLPNNIDLELLTDINFVKIIK